MKEIQIIKRQQMQIREPKNIITKMKNLLYKLSSRVDITEDRFRKFEDRSIAFTQCEWQGEKKDGFSGTRTLRAKKGLTLVLTETQKERRGSGTEKVFKKNNVWNFSNLEKDKSTDSRR